MKLLPILCLTVVAGSLTGCVGLSDLIKEAAKDPAKVRLEFSGWNAHLVYERDNSHAVPTVLTNTAPIQLK